MGQWLDKANVDLAAAEHLHSAAFSGPWVIAFHAQQAAEKYVKAVCVRHQVHFPKTHNLTVLLDLVRRVDAPPAQRLEPSVVLTPYASTERYPKPSPVSADAAAQAVGLARNVRDLVLGHLSDFLEHTE